MANYNVDVELKIKGLNELRQFDRALQSALNTTNSLEKSLKKLGQVNPFSASGARRTPLRIAGGPNLSLDVQNSLLRIKEKQLGIDRDSIRENNRILDQKAEEFMRNQRLLEQERKRLQTTKRRRRENAISSAIIGGGFPLLFGQGPGAALGGALGGGAGGFMGGQMGFALSIAGTAVGSAVDTVVKKTVELGQALNTRTADIETVIQSLGIAGSATNEYIKSLQKAGREKEALSAATAEMASLVGDTGVAALRQFGDDSLQLANVFGQAMTQMQAGIARFLTGIGLTRGLTAAVSNRVLLRQGLANTNDPELRRLQQERIRAGTGGTGATAGLGVGAVEQEIISRVKELNAQREKELKLKLQTQGLSSQELKLLNTRVALAGTSQGLESARTYELERQVVFATTALKVAEAEGDVSEIQKIMLEEKIALESLRQSRAQALLKVEEKSTKETDVQLRKAARQKIDAQNSLQIAQDQFAIASASTPLEQLKAEFAARRNSIERDIQNTLRQQVDPSNALAIEQERKLRNAVLEKQEQQAIKDLLYEQSNSYTYLFEQTTKLNENFVQMSDTINNQIVSGINGMIQGTQTFGEVVSNILQNISSQMIEMAIMGKEGSGGFGGALLSGFASILGISTKAAPVTFETGLSALTGLSTESGFDATKLFGGGIPFRANGGAVSARRPYIVGERGPELFVPGAQGNIVPNNSMGSASIVVNVDASGTQAQGDQPSAKALGAAIGAAVQAELVKQKRPGGLLS